MHRRRKALLRGISTLFLCIAASFGMLSAAATGMQEPTRSAKTSAGGAATRVQHASKAPAIGWRAHAILLARHRQAEHAYRGTSIEPRPEAEGVELVLQRRIADQLERLDFVPPDRPARFRWVFDLGGEILGWRGRIVKTTQVGVGYLVQVRISAIQTTGAAVTNSDVTEFYHFDGQRLRYLRSEQDNSRPRITVFP